MTTSKKHAGLQPISAAMILAMAVLIGIALLVPPFLSSYWRTVVVIYSINALLLVGYRLITSMGGWSFAQIAMMGLGGYTMALLTTKLGWSFWATLVAGPAVAALVAMILAYPVLRTRQYYFFLSTAAAAEAIRQCFLQFTGITGGPYGIPFIQRPTDLFGLPVSSDIGFYYLVLAVFAAISIVVYFGIDRRRLGATIQATAINEDLSESLGIDTFGHRAFAFVAGSAIAGLAGVLLASFNGIVSPSDFTSVAMFKIVAAAIVGGTATFAGPLIGLLYLTGLEEAFRKAAELVPLLWGISVIVVIRLLPDGLEGIFALKPRQRMAVTSVKVAETIDA